MSKTAETSIFNEKSLLNLVTDKYDEEKAIPNLPHLADDAF